MPRPKKVIKAKEPVRIRFKELQNGNKSIYLFSNFISFRRLTRQAVP